MTVNPGYSGQTYIPEMLPKIRKVRRMLDEVNPHAMIQVDGGITVDTLPKTLDAGAQVFVAATAVFKHTEGISAGMSDLIKCFPD
jgi:ribulose-phosphate 3-epimerase